MSVVFKGADFSAPINFVGMYSDGVPMVKTDQFNAIAKNADTIIIRPSSLNSFVVAMFLVDSIKAAGGNLRTLVLPYLPGARQDRVNVDGDVLWTSLSVAHMINSRGFSRVITLDPHSPVMPGYINNLVEYPLERIADWFESVNYDGVIAPDKGAKNRAEIFAAALGVPITYASKNRDVSTGRLSGFSVELEKGKHYLVVDDICDGGGTFLGLGEKFYPQGASADLYVTHGIFSKGVSPLTRFYNNIYTTDSLPHHGGVKMRCSDIIEVVKDMENYNG